MEGGFVTRVGHIMWGQQKERRLNMTTERTLKKWRREALEVLHTNQQTPNNDNVKLVPFATYIIHMTQELLDVHLLQKRS